MFAPPATFNPRAAGRRGFTLVELLVSMAIIGVLASLMLVALFGAQEEARRARTETQIAKIHELIMSKWEEYEGRPVQVLPANRGASPFEAARSRLIALRELQRRELPDRISDIVNPVSLDAASTATDISISPRIELATEPALQQSYLRKVRALFNPINRWSRSNEGSECLYLIISSMRMHDRKAIEFFKEDEIGDTDGDNMPEILDAWGRPIDFLRWAPGHSGLPLSFLQPATLTQSSSGGTYMCGDMEPTIDGNAGDVADPFDIIHVDPRWRDHQPPPGSNDPAHLRNEPFALYPLIYSDGPDGIGNIIRDFNTASLTSGINYSDTTNTANYYVEGAPDPAMPNDPYIHLVPLSSSTPVFVGAAEEGSEAHLDNISNHTLSVR